MGAPELVASLLRSVRDAPVAPELVASDRSVRRKAIGAPFVAKLVAVHEIG